jgi:DeoR family transcriptional regulator, aga operon transcriptional repressor
MLEHIRKRGGASIQELSEAIGISLSTVRRDLEHLEERGYLERSHGGALIQTQLQSTFEPEAEITAEFDRLEKESIGLAAAATLHSGASVIFDSSSTVLAAARASVERDIALTAVTNDLGVGQALSASSRIRVLCLGGTVRPESLTVLGEPGESFLGNLRVDVAFIGTHAISGLALTETSLEAAAMKRAMIAAARRIVLLLADASKFGAAAFCKIYDLIAVHELITDDRADPAEIARARDLGLEVKVVPSMGRATQAVA